MHEPIIDIEMWNKAQEKLNKYIFNRERKYDNMLKGLIYCGECGHKATLRCREEKRKDGTTWSAIYFICSKRNNYSRLCDCKQISANLIEEVVKEKLREELKKISLSDNEIKQIYEQAENESKNENALLYTKLNGLQDTLKNLENSIEEIYQDKINKVIQIEDFKIIYAKKIKEKNQTLEEIENVKKEIKENEKNNIKINLKEIKQIANDFFKIEKPNKLMMEKLIEKIEFNKEKNLKIQLKFQNYNIKSIDIKSGKD